ncbi:MAG: GGDEF domain-containing protein [Mariprofundales bacterium]|nr:GGDEF domain-containing protein [Mariprofundales bacterium]
MLTRLMHFMGLVNRDRHEVDSRDYLHQELLDLLHRESITPLFQPVVHSKRGGLYGYVALSRGPEGSPLHQSEPLFAAARRYNLLFALDSLCRKKAIARFQQLALDGQLFLGIDPRSLSDHAHQPGVTLNELRRHDLSPSRLVVSLMEQHPCDADELQAAVAHYRDMGFAIAVGGVDRGYDNLQLIHKLQPEFISLDSSLVGALAHNPVAKEFVRGVCRLARVIECEVLGDGVEDEVDLKAARKLKIDFVQGGLFGRPAAVPEEWGSKGKDYVVEPSSSVVDRLLCGEGVIGNLCLAVEGAHPTTRAEQVFERLQKDESLMAVPVVKDGVVLGVCERNAMLHRFSMRYGHELYGSKPISHVMNEDPLMVDVNTTFDVVSQMVTGRSHNRLYEPVVLLQDGRYAGVVYVHDILEHITNQSISRAMECNPLTRLPGNLAIEREVNRRLQAREEFVLCYIDLDNFKAFNDRYGYERGDAMIRLLADILRERSRDGDFVGHIGGDDFIFVVEAHPHWEGLVEEVMEDFRSQATQLYDSSDVANGCIKAHDRAGNPCSFGLASLSIGAVPCPAGRYTSHLETAEVAVALKHQAKLHSGNSLQVDRRDHQEKPQGGEALQADVGCQPLPA